jgi:MFS family permease
MRIPPKAAALSLLAATQFVLVLDASIVNVALPSIGRDLGVAPEDLSWVVNAYILMFGGFLLLGGRVADYLGHRRVYAGGLILFAAASMAGALAQSGLWLAFARGLQGLGAALVSPAALAILGGVLTDGLGWQAVLLVNVPVGAAAVALTPRLLPESRTTAGARGFDLAGAVSVTAGLALLVYALVDANDAGFRSTQTLVLAAASLVLLLAFVAIERGSQRPLVPLRIFGSRPSAGPTS